jgi:hypothetical protein
MIRRGGCKVEMGASLVRLCKKLFNTKARRQEEEGAPKLLLLVSSLRNNYLKRGAGRP